MDFTDESYGETYFKYENGIEDWELNAKLKKAGKTELVLESPEGEKTTFDVTVERATLNVTKK